MLVKKLKTTNNISRCGEYLKQDTNSYKHDNFTDKYLVLRKGHFSICVCRNT